MPQLISLAVYGVKVRNVADRTFEILSNFDDNDSDILDFFEDVLTRIRSNTLDQKELQQAMTVTDIDRESRVLKGLVKIGDYGHESDLYNVGTKKVVYHRNKEDAEMLPFYFRFEVPEGTEDGLLILQRTGPHGIMKLVEWVLGTALDDAHPDLKLILSSLADQSQMEEFVRGKVQKITFVRKAIAPDVEDNYDKGHQEVRGTMELVLRAAKGSAIPMNGFLERILGKRKPNGIFELHDDQEFEYDNVKAIVKSGRSTRTINAEKPLYLRPYHAIEDVRMDRDGHPNFESVDEHARELARKFRDILFR
jgi:hypothetical protein